MSERSLSIVLSAAMLLCLAGNSFADHAHTHIGRNPDGIWGNADDTQLWIFAEPDQPQWDTIHMVPTGEFIGSKQIYVAELDCWHSAHPASGLFQLDFNNQLTQPGWRIGLKRISYSDPVNFWMENEATTLEILTSNGATYTFEEPDWDSELPNGSGGTGAWHFHNHTEFLCLADEAGQTFSATFTVFDNGATNFAESTQYTLDFVTVPEPCTAVLLGLGAVLSVKNRRKRD